MLNTELHCIKLIIRYIHLLTTLMLDQLLHAVVDCHTVSHVLRIVQ